MCDKQRCTWSGSSGLAACPNPSRYVLYDGIGLTRKPVLTICSDHLEEIKKKLQEEKKRCNFGILVETLSPEERLKLLDSALKALGVYEPTLLFTGEEYLHFNSPETRS